MDSFLILLSLLVISATSLSVPQRQDASVIAEVSNKLGVKLIKKLTAADDGNVFFSPVSITTALAMLFYGTRGTTADEMRRALGYQEAGLTDNQVHSAFQSLVEMLSENSGPKEYFLYLANAVFTQLGYPIRDEYKTGLQEIYNAETRNVDFGKQGLQTVMEINDWVKQKTNNQITQLLRHVNPSTVMVLLNAVYFKGKWEKKFEQATKGIFYNKGLETEKVEIPMMSSQRVVLYARREGAQAIELPYKGENISILICLPDALDGLQRLVQNATPNTMKNIRKSAREATVRIRLPKFKLEYKKTLNTVLQDLGIVSAFQQSADLSGISPVKGLAVSDVVHKAVVEVNEEGTEASGATGVIITKTSTTEKIIDFVVDHPFGFAIIDKSNNLVLFQGRVNEL